MHLTQRPRSSTSSAVAPVRICSSQVVVQIRAAEHEYSRIYGPVHFASITHSASRCRCPVPLSAEYFPPSPRSTFSRGRRLVTCSMPRQFWSGCVTKHLVGGPFVAGVEVLGMPWLRLERPRRWEGGVLRVWWNETWRCVWRGGGDVRRLFRSRVGN